MKRICCHILLLISAYCFSQTNFKIVIPNQPVLAGQSFQVQYVIENGDYIYNFLPPLFKNFRFVAGPHSYSGKMMVDNKKVSYTNFILTLEAIHKGKFIIPAATC